MGILTVPNGKAARLCWALVLAGLAMSFLHAMLVDGSLAKILFASTLVLMPIFWIAWLICACQPSTARPKVRILFAAWLSLNLVGLVLLLRAFFANTRFLADAGSELPILVINFPVTVPAAIAFSILPEAWRLEGIAGSMGRVFAPISIWLDLLICNCVQSSLLIWFFRAIRNDGEAGKYIGGQGPP